MCELFAANSRQPVELNAELETFFGDSVMHLHGWDPLPKRRLLAFRDGELVRASEPRGGLYHFDERELDAYILANAA